MNGATNYEQKTRRPKKGDFKHAVLDHDGVPIKQSNDMRCIRRYAGKAMADTVRITKHPNNTALLEITFHGGATYQTEFASHIVLCGVLNRWRSLWDAELYVNNQLIGRLKDSRPL